MEGVGKRGIALVSVLFFVMAVGLFARAILINGPVMSALANHSAHEVLAMRAIDAGASYARNRLRDDGGWDAGLTARTTTTVVDMPNLKVVEDRGNVVGWIRGANGDVSRFRIRFNYQDGAVGGDNCPDPTAPYFIDNVYLSMNNVFNARANVKNVPLVDPNTFRVTDPTSSEFDLEGTLAVLRVEGSAGPALRNSTGPAVGPERGVLASRVMRIVLGSSVDQGPNTALNAANRMLTQTDNGTFIDTLSARTNPLVRGKGDVLFQAHDGTDALLDMDGIVTYRDNFQAVAGPSVTTQPEVDSQDLPNVPWSDVPVASTNPGEAVQLKAGIYAQDLAGNYFYYDMTPAEYKALTPDSSDRGLRPGYVELDNNWSQTRSDSMRASALELDTDYAPFKMTVTEDVNVVTSDAGHDHIVITSLGGRKLFEDPGNTSTRDEEYYFADAAIFDAPGTLAIEDSVISSVGDMVVLINVAGDNGSMTTEGEAILAAPSVSFESDRPELLDQRLSVYSKGDLTISTYIDQVGFPPYVPPYTGYGPLLLEGLTYTWSNINIYAATPGEPNGPTSYGRDKHGLVEINGAMVAYGADPGASTGTWPGDILDPTRPGNMNMYGLQVDVTYDPNKLGSSSAQSSGPVGAYIRKAYGFEN